MDVGNATHVLVDYYHKVIEENDERANVGVHFCGQHAFDDGRESCHICVADGATTETFDEATELDVEMLRTYPPGATDSDDCCSDHP